MKAIYIEHHGDIGNLIFGDFEDPVFGPNEVLIKVRASSVNRRDIFTRMGVKGTKLDLDTPQILGGDASGDVIDFGEFTVDDLERPNKHVFFAGKIFLNSNKIPTYVNLFTIVMD